MLSSSLPTMSDAIHQPTALDSAQARDEGMTTALPQPDHTKKHLPVDTATGRPIQPSYRTPQTCADPSEVHVAPDYVEKVGHVLANGWVLGKQLGHGVQGRVYLLEDQEGNDAGRVFKVVNVRAIARVSGALVGVQREWAIGREVNLLNDEDGFLDGFMQTGSKVLSPKGKFLGAILEKLNGKDVKDRLEDTQFNDIDYILAMVMQVLRSLDRALTAIGFQHRDTNAHNVMEHWFDEERAGTAEKIPPTPQKHELGKKMDLRGLHFKLIDYGHSFTNNQQASDAEKRRQASRIKEPKVPVYSAERFYRGVFHGRSDVWRFMLSIGRALEGRVWERKDEKKVELLMSVIRYATGYSHTAYYASSPEEHQQGCFNRSMAAGGPLYGLQWLGIMSRGYFCPSHPATTPREALDFIEEQRIRLGLSKGDLP